MSFEGFLHKRLAAPSPPAMEYCYCLLLGTTLWDFSSKDDLLTGAAPLREVEIIGVSEWDGKGRIHSYSHGFVFVTEQGTTYHAAAPDAAARGLWLHAMRLGLHLYFHAGTDDLHEVKVKSALFSAPEKKKNSQCPVSGKRFSLFDRGGAWCRSCGRAFAPEHCAKAAPLPQYGLGDACNLCDDCFVAQLFLIHLKMLNGRLGHGTALRQARRGEGPPGTLRLAAAATPAAERTRRAAAALELLGQGAAGEAEAEELIRMDWMYADEARAAEAAACRQETEGRAHDILGLLRALLDAAEDGAPAAHFQIVLEHINNFAETDLDIIDFFWPQLVHLHFLLLPAAAATWEGAVKADLLESVLLGAARRCPALAVRLLWALLGYLEDLDLDARALRLVLLGVEAEAALVGPAAYARGPNPYAANRMLRSFLRPTPCQLALVLAQLRRLQRARRRAASGPLGPRGAALLAAKLALGGGEEEEQGENGEGGGGGEGGGEGEGEAATGRGGPPPEPPEPPPPPPPPPPGGGGGGPAAAPAPPPKLREGVLSETSSGSGGSEKDSPLHRSMEDASPASPVGDWEPEVKAVVSDIVGQVEAMLVAAEIHKFLDSSIPIPNEPKNESENEFKESLASEGQLLPAESSNELEAKNLSSTNLSGKLHQLERLTSDDIVGGDDVIRGISPRPRPNSSAGSGNKKKDLPPQLLQPERESEQPPCLNEPLQPAEYFKDQLLFIRRLGYIAEKLRFVDPADKDARKQMLVQELEKLEAAGMSGFLPLAAATEPPCRIVRIPPTEGHVFRTKARAPTLIVFEVLRPPEEEGPGDAEEPGGGEEDAADPPPPPAAAAALSPGPPSEDLSAGGWRAGGAPASEPSEEPSDAEDARSEPAAAARGPPPPLGAAPAAPPGAPPAATRASVPPVLRPAAGRGPRGPHLYGGGGGGRLGRGRSLRALRAGAAAGGAPVATSKEIEELIEHQVDSDLEEALRPSELRGGGAGAEGGAAAAADLGVLVGEARRGGGGGSPRAAAAAAAGGGGGKGTPRRRGSEEGKGSGGSGGGAMRLLSDLASSAKGRVRVGSLDAGAFRQSLKDRLPRGSHGGGGKDDGGGGGEGGGGDGAAAKGLPPLPPPLFPGAPGSAAAAAASGATGEATRIATLKKKMMGLKDSAKKRMGGRKGSRESHHSSRRPSASDSSRKNTLLKDSDLLALHSSRSIETLDVFDALQKMDSTHSLSSLMNAAEVKKEDIDRINQSIHSIPSTFMEESSAVKTARKLFQEGVISQEELAECVANDAKFQHHQAEAAHLDLEFGVAAAFGEGWEAKAARVRRESPHGRRAGWELHSLIVKSNDDLRQEVCMIQMIELCQHIFLAAGIDLWLRPYRIISTSATTGLIETISDAMSLDALKKREGHVSLADHFEKTYGPEDSAQREQSMKNFVQSLAAYSLICYIFSIKDRHNGNILLDTEGHIVHIDFGFILGIAPGGYWSMETCPFKLTEEMVEAMGGPRGRWFMEFVVGFTCGFLALQEQADRIAGVVEIMARGSPFPCFAGRGADGDDPAPAVRAFRARFAPGLAKEQVVAHCLDLIKASYNHYGMKQYDNFQWFTNGIMP